MPRLTAARIIALTACPFVDGKRRCRAKTGEPCRWMEAGKVHDERREAHRKEHPPGRPKLDDGEGLDAAIALRVKSATHAAYQELPGPVSKRLVGRLRRIVEKATGTAPK